jgi:hypothetical protein
MALTEIYVDPSIAGNSGTGTIGDPYGDLQYALDQTTKGTNGDRFNIKAGTAEILSSILSFSTYGNPSLTQPVVFQGYTSAQGDGGIGEITANGSNFSIFTSTAVDYHSWVDLKLGNCGTAIVLGGDNDVNVINCEIHTSSNQYPLDLDSRCNVIGCYFHDLTGSGNIRLLETSNVRNCFLDDGTTAKTSGSVFCQSGQCLVSNNVIKQDNVSSVGVIFSSTDSKAYSNSIYNDSVGTGAGIRFTGDALGATVLNNAIEGYSGVGGVAIEGTNASSEAPLFITGNVYYNNTTMGSSWAGEPPLVERDNTNATATLFTDPANDNLEGTTELKEKAYPQLFNGSATDNKEDAGAAQREEAGGGSVSQALAY